MPHTSHLPLPQIDRQLSRQILLRVRVDFRVDLRCFTVYTWRSTTCRPAREGRSEEVAWLALAGGGCARVGTQAVGGCLAAEGGLRCCVGGCGAQGRVGEGVAGRAGAGHGCCVDVRLVCLVGDSAAAHWNLFLAAVVH